MGVADRVRRKQRERREAQEDISRPDSLSSLVLVDPPHIARLKGVLSVLRGFIEQNQDGSGMARMGFVLTTIGNELADELVDMDELQIRIFLAQIGEVIAWVGHGDNERLPESVKMFAETIQPGASNTDSDSPIEIGATPR
jgi:hypothetical protein